MFTKLAELVEEAKIKLPNLTELSVMALDTESHNLEKFADSHPMLEIKEACVMDGIKFEMLGDSRYGAFCITFQPSKYHF